MQLFITTINKQLIAGLHIHTVIMIFTKQPSATPLAMEATHGCASKFIAHSIRVAEGGWLHGRYELTPWDTASELLKGGGWLHVRYALTPWDAASELLKVEGEGGFMGGMH